MVTISGGDSFKLHLRPDSVSASDVIKKNLPPLPFGKSIVQVFADFLKYLFACARKYIIESVANGKSLWSQVERDVVFVLAHPNGWEGPQQNKMRDAAVLAGLVPDTNAGRDRIHFVTEGEASVHYCIQNGLIGNEEKVCAMIKWDVRLFIFSLSRTKALAMT